MKIDEICKDLLELKNIIKILKPTSVEFSCSKCGKEIKLHNYICFLRRKDLLCHSCKMKIVNNKTEDKIKRGHTKTLKNRQTRSSQKREQELIEKYFKPHHLIIKNTFFDKNNEKNYCLECEYCHNTFLWNEYQRNANIGITQNPYCKKCFNSTVSNEENELYRYIKNIYFDEIIKNDRNTIRPKEIDIYLPKLKLGFEFDGLFYHKGNNYKLLDKSILCGKKGIKLIHILESDWQDDTKEKTKIILKKILKKESIIDDISFVKDNVLYIDKRFSPEKLKDKFFLKTTLPKKLYFFNKHITDTIVDNNLFIYNCGYDCYSLDGKNHIIEESPKIEIYENKEIFLNNFNNLNSLPPYQKISFICPKCKKEKHYIAETMQNADELICGNCRQALNWKKTWILKKSSTEDD